MIEAGPWCVFCCGSGWLGDMEAPCPCADEGADPRGGSAEGSPDVQQAGELGVVRGGSCLRDDLVMSWYLARQRRGGRG